MAMTDSNSTTDAGTDTTARHGQPLGSRRAFLQGAILVAGTSLLAACAPAATPAAPTAAAPQPTSPPAPAPTAAATTAPAPAAAATTAPAAVARTGSARTFKVTGPVAIDGYTPIWIGQINGYFEKEGLNLELGYASGAAGRAALLTKEYDLFSAAFATVAPAAEAQQPIKFITGTADSSNFSVIVRSDLKDKIKSVADLKGYTLGYPTAGGTAWFLGLAFLAQAGLDPEKDLTYVATGADPSVPYAAMKVGKVDALMTWEPITSRAIDEGTAYGLVRSWVPEDRKKYMGAEKDLASMIVTRDDVIKDRPQDLQAFANAMKSSIAYIKSTPSADLAKQLQTAPTVKEQFESIDPKLLASSIDKTKGSNSVCMSRDGYDVQMTFMVKYGLLKAPIPYEKLVDNQFVGSCG